MAGSLVFGALVSDVVDDGALAAGAALSTYTVLWWLNPSTLTGNRVLWSRGGGTTKAARLNGTGGNVEGIVLRATTNTQYATTSTPLATGVACFLAMTVDVNAGTAAKVQFYSGRVGVPATACTMAVTTEGSGTPTDDTAFNERWGNNVALTAAFQGSMAFVARFSGILSLADIQSWQLEPRQVVNSSIAYNFKMFGVDGADALDFAGNANGTVSGATQGATYGISTPLSQNQALVTAAGGNTTLFAVHDRRMNLTTDLQTWGDAIKLAGSRAAGLSLTQATGGNRPTLTSAGRLLFTAASSQYYATGQDARLLFSATTPLYMLSIAKTTAGTVVAVANDITSLVAYPFAAIQGDTNWKGLFRPDSTGTAQTAPDSGLACAGGVIRASVFGRGTRLTGTHDDAWRFWGSLGRQPNQHTQAAAAAVVGGGLKASVGRIGSTYLDGEVCWVGFMMGDPTAAFLQAFATFANTYHGATTDTSTFGTILFVGNSNVVGTQTTNRLAATMASGTTTFPYFCANATGGPRAATFAGQGLDAGDVHKYNLGHGGIGITSLTTAFPYEVAPVCDGFRSGNKILVFYEEANSQIVEFLTLAQMKTKAIAYYALCQAAGIKLWYCTGGDMGGAGAIGTSGYGWYNSDGSISTQGQIILDWHAELIANTALYCDRLVLTETGVAKITIRAAGAMATKSSANTTNYHTDYVHFKDPTTTDVGAYIRAQFDSTNAFADPLWTTTSAGSSGDSGTMQRMIRRHRRKA